MLCEVSASGQRDKPLWNLPINRMPSGVISRITWLPYPWNNVPSNNSCSIDRLPPVLTVPPRVWIENQLEGVYEGQTVTLACHSEAFPRPITYWTRPTDQTIINGWYTLRKSRGSISRVKKKNKKNKIRKTIYLLYYILIFF